MLEVKAERCAGIDVGKKFLAVCVLIGPANRKPVEEVRRFGTDAGEFGTAAGMVARKRLHGSGDGEHGILLEAHV